MSRKSTKIQNDARFMAALHAISNIELRAWPEDAPLYVFHESFESDIAMIKVFCKDRRIFGRNSRAIDGRSYELILMSKPVFAYYLPAVLLAMIQYPRGPLARAMLAGRLYSEGGFTSAELEAIEAVANCLAEHGTTRDAILANIERGRKILQDLRDEASDQPSDDREPTPET